MFDSTENNYTTAASYSFEEEWPKCLRAAAPCPVFPNNATYRTGS